MHIGGGRLEGIDGETDIGGELEIEIFGWEQKNASNGESSITIRRTLNNLMKLMLSVIDEPERLKWKAR